MDEPTADTPSGARSMYARLDDWVAQRRLVALEFRGDVGVHEVVVQRRAEHVLIGVSMEYYTGDGVLLAWLPHVKSIFHASTHRYVGEHAVAVREAREQELEAGWLDVEGRAQSVFEYIRCRDLLAQIECIDMREDADVGYVRHAGRRAVWIEPVDTSGANAHPVVRLAYSRIGAVLVRTRYLNVLQSLRRSHDHVVDGACDIIDFQPAS